MLYIVPFKCSRVVVFYLLDNTGFMVTILESFSVRSFLRQFLSLYRIPKPKVDISLRLTVMVK